MKNEGPTPSPLVDDSELNTEFTYHRHSEEKNMIYFRCSDKSCKARVLFSKTTSQFTFKNRHLSPSVHKPNSKKAITGHQIAKIASLVKCPVALRAAQTDVSMLICDETLVLPAKTSRSMLSSQSECLIKIFVTDPKQAEYFCEVLVCNKISHGAISFYKQKKMKVYPKGSCRECVVEVECKEEQREEVSQLIGQVLGEVRVEVMRKV
jgi:hypothetical protein